MPEDWKARARSLLKIYYQGFAGTQWHKFDVNDTDLQLLKIKIAYAVYGPPEDNTETVENAYKEEQRSKAQEILELLLKVKRHEQRSNIKIGFAFVVCYQSGEEKEYSLPVFSVLVDSSNGNDKRNFVDTQGRTYKSWDDWKQNNCLPKVDYAYPKFGYFTCSSDGSYSFEPERDPVIEFGHSPQCGTLAKVLHVVDCGTSITSIGSGIVGIVGLIPALSVAPAILTTAAIVGSASAIYGAARGAGLLYDKGTHSQSLKDLESLTIWFSIVATPFHFASSAVSGALAKGAVQQGRIFSNSMRMFATVLMCTTLGMDSVLFSFSLINLIQKAKNKELKPLDVLQFSISTFFFTNTLIQPKTASSVIRKAQKMHFQQTANSMTDEAAKTAFNKFLETNKVDGSITDRSKIVRAINRMNDPQALFKTAGPDSTVTIGGRKGKTVILNDQNNYAQRVNTSKIIASNVVPSGAQTKVKKFKKESKLIREVFEDDPKNVELNGNKIFDNLDNRQKGDISRKFCGRYGHDKEIILKAHSIAKEMGCTTLEQYLSIVEIVATEVSGMSGDALTNALKNMDQRAFISGIQKELATAEGIANRGGLSFEDPYKAVYHYRKHGTEFPKMIMKHGNTLEVYLEPVANHVIQSSNLQEIVRLGEQDMKYIYATPKDEYGVLITNSEGVKLCTMFRNIGCTENNASKLAQFLQNAPSTEPVSEVAQSLARNLGFRSYHVVLSVDGTKKPLEDCLDVDLEIHQEIANLLNAINSIWI